MNKLVWHTPFLFYSLIFPGLILKDYRSLYQSLTEYLNLFSLPVRDSVSDYLKDLMKEEVSHIMVNVYL